MSEVVMVCKEDGIVVIRTATPTRVIGRGNRNIDWKHTKLHDEDGNPYCGRTLSNNDVEPQAST